MRNAFIEELVNHAHDNPNIALIVGDLGYSVVEPFAERFPDRFVNAGIAEQNMMGVAAGMASEGYHVFVYSIGNFPTFRCAEQIRNDIDYHRLPVTVVAVGGGLSYGALGYSHHTIQDYALIRSMPNMLIAAPGDPIEVRACMRYLIANPQQSYLRLAKSGETPIHEKVPNIKPGKWVPVLKNDNERIDSSHIILSTGGVLPQAINMARSLKGKAHHVFSMPLWGQSYKIMQSIQVEKAASLITLEDHLIDGGFGSWMLEAVAGKPDIMSRVSIKALDPKVCGMVASQETLNRTGGITQ